MKVCVIGWYGTETIGDRAIIAGIYSFLLKNFKDVEINLGSLYPFYSQRMINEDKYLYRNIFNKDIKIEMFNSKDKNELEENIRKSDFLIMGGGPIMHISELYMIEYAFKYARKKGMYTGIIGCGVGPVFNNEFKKSTINIIKNSDIIILRDEKSKKNLVDIFKEFNENLNADKIKVSFDPAVECALKFLSIKREFIKSDEILINLRDFPKEYSRDEDNLIINNILEEFIVNVSKKFNNNVIRLIPMHYFHIGDDDRNFLNKIKLKNKLDNVVVQNEVLSLEETMDKFLQAKFCIGMRFHSVVLQTILNGKNLILDYTEPKRGKISGFISDIDDLNFYENRFVSLQEIENIPMEILHDNFEKNRFTYDYDILNIKLDVYNSELSKIKVDKQERIK